jgi:hypothetical protein
MELEASKRQPRKRFKQIHTRECELPLLDNPGLRGPRRQGEHYSTFLIPANRSEQLTANICNYFLYLCGGVDLLV